MQLVKRNLINLIHILILLPIWVSAQNADHILLTRVVTQGGTESFPSAAESFSIYNPADTSIDLSNYYICDDKDYYQIQTGATTSNLATGFTAQFPAISIDPGDTFHIVLNEHYNEIYSADFVPDLVMFTGYENSMLETYTEPFSSFGGGSNKIEENGEMLILFYWDGNVDSLIQDVDYFLWGNTQDSEKIDKSGISDYQDDTPTENQSYFEDIATLGSAYSRINSGGETGEDGSGGNGITGHDETDENFKESWEIIELFNFGCTDENASNYDPEADIDDDSCEYIQAISDIINGSFLGKEITTEGTVVALFDISTVSCSGYGSKMITIEDEQHNALEISSWDIPWTTLLDSISTCPYSRYKIRVSGTVTEYCPDICEDFETPIACVGPSGTNTTSGEGYTGKNKCMWDADNEICVDYVCAVQYEDNIEQCNSDCQCIWNVDDGICEKDCTSENNWECSLARSTGNTEDNNDSVDWNYQTQSAEAECEWQIAYPTIEIIDEYVVSPTLVNFQDILIDGNYLDGDYYHKSVKLQGVITDYFDVTKYCGPHAVTISEETTGKSLEITMWDDDWNDNLECDTQPPFFTKEVQLTGFVDEYCDDDDGICGLQIQACMDGDLGVDVIEPNYEWEIPTLDIPDILAGSYDGQPVTTRGTIVDYFDITIYNGPHAITIEDENYNELEISIWPDYWDATLAEYASCPYSRYEIEVTGIVNEYCGPCYEFTDATSCNDDEDCMWNGGSCIKEDCEIQYTSSPTDCEADEDCIWNVDDGICEKDCTSDYNWECSLARSAGNTENNDDLAGWNYQTQSAEECSWQLQVVGISGIELKEEHEVSPQLVSFQDVLDGDYYHQSVILNGVIGQYADITKMCGPHAITLSEVNTTNSLELTMWDNDWSDELECLTQPPFFTKEVQVTGFVGEYEGDTQIQVCGDLEVVNENYEWGIPTLDIPDILAGSYDGQPVTTRGTIVDYFDITIFDGPHAITIEDEDYNELEISIWPDYWDATLAEYASCPYSRYEIEVTGVVNEYCGPCYKFTDATSCNDDEDCMWNGGSCIKEECKIQYTSLTDCEADEDCIWNVDDGICKNDCTSDYNWECSLARSTGNTENNDDSAARNYQVQSAEECSWQLQVAGISGIELKEKHEVSPKLVSFQDVLDGDYYHQSVKLQGVITDYYDITPSCGPHAITISEATTCYNLELAMWNNEWNNDLECLTQQPFFTKEIQFIGSVDEYEGNTQIQVCGEITILNENYDYQVCEGSIKEILDGSLNNKTVACEGLLVDYFDITVYDGPHALTIKDEQGYALELSIWPNSYDIPNSIHSYLLQPPYNRFLLSAVGGVGEYAGEKQLSISGANSITVSDTINLEGTEYTGLMVAFTIEAEYDEWGIETSEEFITNLAIQLSIDKERISIINIRQGSVILDINIRNDIADDNTEQSNADLSDDISDITQVNGFEVETEIEQLSVNRAIIKPAPFVIIPTLGEKLDYTYSYPKNSRVIIRIYDLSGRFVTSLVDKYYEDSNTVYRVDDQSSWDGRDKLGQIVAPGTYIMHIEAMNVSTGETHTDAAPVVVGVQN